MRIRHLLVLGILTVASYAAPPPLLQTVPNYDVAAGGRTVAVQSSETFTGTDAEYQVAFGAAQGQIVSVDDTALTVLVPPGTAPGQVTVTVTDLRDAMSAAVPGAFYYITGPPTISKVVDPANPDEPIPTGSTRGGHAVVVEGSGLTFTTSVEFGGIPASPASIQVLSDTQVAVSTPASSAGVKSVGVQITPGNLETFTSGLYRYVSAPAPEQVFPAVGAVGGGTATTVFGQALANATSVTFGGVPATIVLNVAERIEVIVGPHAAGVVDVVVSNAVDSATLPGAFTFFNPPDVTGISPPDGPAAGGNEVAITGTNLFRLLEVRFGGVKATTRSITDTQLVVLAPPHAAGEVTVEVSTVGGKDTTTYTYVAQPQVTSLDPIQGSTRGGYPVTVSGIFLSNPQAVFFGADEATVLDASDTEIQVVAPPRDDTGIVPVSVITRGGTGTRSNAFTYVRAIGIDGVSPSRGFTDGGETITIHGTGFNGLQSVWVGGTPTLVSSIEGSTEIVIISPPGVVGFADIEVRTIAESFLQPDVYEYIDPDTLFGSLRGAIRDMDADTPLTKAIVVARIGGTVVGAGAADANGEYLITSLDPGEYNLEVFAIGHQRDIANATVIAGEEETINFALGPLPPAGGSIAGRVTELLNDTPLVGARVQAIHATGIITTYTCADGAYDLPGIPLGDTLEVTVASSAPGYDPTERQVMIGNQFANFIMNRGVLPGKMSGTVLDAETNEPIADTQVFLTPTLGMLGYSRTPNASGGFNLKNVDYATYDLRVSAKDYVPHFQHLTLTTVAGQQIVVKLQLAGGGGTGCAGGPVNPRPVPGDFLALTGAVLYLLLAHLRRVARAR